MVETPTVGTLNAEETRNWLANYIGISSAAMGAVGATVGMIAAAQDSVHWTEKQVALLIPGYVVVCGCIGFACGPILLPLGCVVGLLFGAKRWYDAAARPL